jgi:hypothetical protein
MIGPKFTIRKILATIALLWLIVPAVCLALPTDPAVPAGQTGGTPATPPASQDAGVSADELFQRFKYTTTTTGTKLDAVNALPQKDWKATLTGIIKILLNISGALTLLSFTVGGVMMIVSQGNGDLLEKGKRITYYSVAGLVIIAVSYAVVIGVSELQIFTPGAGGGGQQSSSSTPAAPAAAPGENSTALPSSN